MKNQSKAKRKKKHKKTPKQPKPKQKIQKNSHTLFPLCANKSNLFDDRVNVDNVVAVILPRSTSASGNTEGRCTLVEWREFYLFCIFYGLFL